MIVSVVFLNSITNHSHALALLLRVRIVFFFKDEYVEGNEITGVSVLLSLSPYR